MSEELEGWFTPSEEMIEHPKEMEEGPTLSEVSDRRVSIEEAPAIIPQEEKPQEKEQEQERQEPKISKRKQKGKRTISYLSNISRQVEKNGNQINKIVIMIQTLQRQKQTKPITGAEESKSQLQSIKEIKSRISQLQKQVIQIQNEIRRIRTTSVTGTRIRARAKIRKRTSHTVTTLKLKRRKSRNRNSYSF